MTYRIHDEPRPGPLQPYTVNPFWPLLAVMFAGVWLGWLWFAFNAAAVGSPTRRREWTLIGVGFAVTTALAIALVVAVRGGVIDSVLVLRLALLGILLWKIGVSYALHALQSRTFHLYEYYGGVTRNGLAIVIAGMVVGRPLVVGLFDNLLWRIIVSAWVPGL